MVYHVEPRAPALCLPNVPPDGFTLQVTFTIWAIQRQETMLWHSRWRSVPALQMSRIKQLVRAISHPR